MKWKRGQKTTLARLAGISKAHLSNILCRRSRVNVALALRLEKASQEMGLVIPRECWVFNFETTNPYFKAVSPC